MEESLINVDLRPVIPYEINQPFTEYEVSLILIFT